jgi:MATE family multidrug resistance protein
MGTTGFTAQAAGAGDEPEVRATLLRAGLLAGAIGLALVLLRGPIGAVAFALFGGTEEVEAVARDYFAIRIWGAPAALGNFAVMGAFIGLGESRRVLVTQVFLNGLNIALDVMFAAGLGWGARGIAAGTAIAEWSTLVLSVSLAARLLRARRADGGPLWEWARVRNPARLRQLLGANANIMIRTLALVFGFAWFTNRSAELGDAVLAANHVLLQFLSFSAFFLDGYAHAAESLVGSAIGAGSVARFDGAVRRSTELAAATAVALAALLLGLGDVAIRLLTDAPSVRTAASEQLPLAALYVLLAFGAYQLDGVFIGATRTRAMRDASIGSLLIFLAVAAALTARAGNRGLWLAFTVYVVARAATLALLYPALRRSVGAGAG